MTNVIRPHIFVYIGSKTGILTKYSIQYSVVLFIDFQIRKVSYFDYIFAPFAIAYLNNFVSGFDILAKYLPALLRRSLLSAIIDTNSDNADDTNTEDDNEYGNVVDGANDTNQADVADADTINSNQATDTNKYGRYGKSRWAKPHPSDKQNSRYSDDHPSKVWKRQKNDDYDRGYGGQRRRGPENRRPRRDDRGWNRANNQDYERYEEYEHRDCRHDQWHRNNGWNNRGDRYHRGL